MKTDILNQCQKIMDRAIRLADINNPESRDIERVMNAEGLYEQLKNINWFDLLQEMSENSEYYSFKGYFTHYQEQLQKVMDQYPADVFDREGYDFMDGDNPVFQYYRSRDDADNFGVFVALLRLLRKKMTELQGCFEQKEVHIARLAEENLAYAHEYTNYTWEKAGAVYDRLVEKGCLMDQEWGRETFCFRLTGRKKGNLFITVLLQWCKSNILLYMFLKELVPDDGKIWVKSGVFFRLRDGSIINPETAKRELQRMKTGSKKNEGLVRYLVHGEK